MFARDAISMCQLSLGDPPTPKKCRVSHFPPTINVNFVSYTKNIKQHHKMHNNWLKIEWIRIFQFFLQLTSCARGQTICLAPATWQYLRICSGMLKLLSHQQQVDLWSFDLESVVRVTCDVRYPCDNFSPLRPLFSRVIRPMTETKASLLMPPPMETEA